MSMKKRTFLIPICLLTFFFCTFAVAQVKETEISQILHRLEKKASSVTSLETDVIQKKKLAAFKNEIVLKGKIYMQGADKLIWHVNEPVKYSVLITDKFIRQWDGEIDKIQEIPLSDSPVMSIVVEQIRSWFSGRYADLLKNYNVSLLQKKPIVLKFVPKDGTIVEKVIRSVSLAFQKDEKYLKWIKIEEASGDSTTIIFDNTILNPSLNDKDFEVKRRV